MIPFKISHNAVASIIIIILFNPQFGYSQNNKEKGSTVSETLTNIERRILFNKEFTSALSDIPNNYIGNYASVDITSSKASFATSFIREKSAFGFNVSGGTSDGTLRFVNNNKLNYNITVGAQYHFIDPSKKVKLIVDVDQWESYRLQTKKIKDEANKEITAIEKEENLKPLISKRNKLKEKKAEIEIKQTFLMKNPATLLKKEAIEDQIEVIDRRLQDANDYLKGKATYTNKKMKALAALENCFTETCKQQYIYLTNDREVKQTLMKKEFLEKKKQELKEESKSITLESTINVYQSEIEKLKKSIAEIDKEINDLKEQKSLLISLRQSKKAKDLKEHYRKGFDTYGAVFNWFSIGARATFNSFILYDASLPFIEQLDEQEGANYELTLQHSWHKRNELDRWRSYLINLGTSITYGDNLQRLSPRVLEDTNTIESQGNITRTTRNETNVFIGDYKDDISGMRIYTDAYYFLFSGNYAAIHLYPNVQLLEDQKPVFNTELGLVLSYKDKDKPNTLVSAELFYAFNDIGNSIEADSNFTERNTIGLRLVLPISFKN
ncbi:hypothetical protein [Aquimarina sp. SS2-1]|uniref:hypothetical protein n=1 Tax=Aquimarina besae TaxID=3342247 RepID=UPI00366BE735